ncbi:MAG: aminopeptidase P family protein [Thaumarchaeota archaeon]|nr:aminopeptidase P family protein [Nitrososphaerota archaeon]
MKIGGYKEKRAAEVAAGRVEEAMFEQRVKRVFEQASKKGFSQVIATTPQNVFYLTGFWGGGYVVLSEGKMVFVTGTLEGERAAAQVKGAEVIVVPRGKSMLDAAASLCGEAKSVCIDDASLSVFNALSKKVKSGVVCDPDAFYSARRVKDAYELEALVDGGRIVDKIYERAFEVVRVGITERKVQGELIMAACELGCDIPGFSETLNPFIVASGPNSAFPHAELSDRGIQKGDFVVMDLVVRYRGYIVDTTRTFGVGSVNVEMKEVYSFVQDAQTAGIEQAKPGVTSGDVDKASRQFIENKGYGSFFTHSTGHGVGIDVHEEPRVSPDAKETLLRHDAITVEPGIYLTGKFGVRIEDSLIVDESPKLLTSYPRELIVVG